MWTKLVILIQAIMMSRQNVISIAQGKIRGMVLDGYVAYTGIPYANISNSDGKFKIAGIAPVWSNVRDPKTSTCSSLSAAEDCLQLDVYAPIAVGTSWPVLVWVTGGSGPYNPRKLVKENIITVIIYHRQGPHGFLCLGDEAIPGNAGVKDVVLALRWVRDNIVAFYGNPDKIVVAGQSFGAAMVDAIILSSMAPGLFHGAILQSGTALCPWAFNYDAEERARALMDTSDEDRNEDLVKFLINAENEGLVTRSYRLAVPYFPFGICREKRLRKAEGLLFEAPFDLITTKKVKNLPIMIGYNSNEAYVFLSIIKEAKVIQRLKQTFTFLLPDELKLLNDRERRQVARQIRDIYFKKNITLASVLAYHRDAYFTSHIHRSVIYYSSTTPVYYYQFSYNNDIGVQSDNNVKKEGAAHSDELGYLFSDVDLNEEDKVVEQRLLKLWSNFIKNLNPTPSTSEVIWEPTRPEHPRLMDIDIDLKMIDYPHAKTTHVWNSIYEKYYYTRNRIGAKEELKSFLSVYKADGCHATANITQTFLFLILLRYF